MIINGVKWATRNVDKPGTFATSPEDPGMFYQWNRSVGWNTTDPIMDSNGGTTWNESLSSGAAWLKENDPSPAGWRIPTLDEIQTLFEADKVNNEFTTQNGAYGRKFTDKNTGNSIFLPSVGYRGGSLGLLNPVGSSGIWSSTQYNSSSAHYLRFANGLTKADYVARNFGYSELPLVSTCITMFERS